MSIRWISWLMCAFILAGCSGSAKEIPFSESTEETPVRVGVFNRNGESPFCIIDALEALKIDSGIAGRIVSAADIMSGAAADIDVFLFPGGSGKKEAAALGYQGQAAVIAQVRQAGKGIVGICAGAYLLTRTPHYPGLGLSGARAIDIEHDHRGHGLVRFRLTDKGAQVFPELAAGREFFCQYYEGPVLVPEKESGLHYSELATMLSDVHTVRGTPANMTSNRPFIIFTRAGKGRVVSVVGHPESTPGMRWMVPRLVRLAAGRKLKTYSKAVVRPQIYTREILFTEDLLDQQKTAFENLSLRGPKKLRAMQDLVTMCAWSARKRIPQLLRDREPGVRLLAAELTLELERTDALPDLEAAVFAEKDARIRSQLKGLLDRLIGMLGCEAGE